MKKMIALILVVSSLCGVLAAEETKEKTKVIQKKAFMGVALKEIKEDADKQKVIILDVFDNSAADAAGLISEDMILKINGREVADIEEIRELLKEALPHENIELIIDRGGKTQMIDLTLGEEPHSDHVKVHQFKKAFFIGEPRPYVGIQMKNLKGQLAEFFGVEQGILVEGVTEESPAFAAGIQAGDVILEMTGNPISSSSDLLRLLEERQPGDEVLFRIKRKNEEMDIPVLLGKNDSGTHFILHGDDDVDVMHWVDEASGEVKIEVKTTIEKEE